MIPDIEKFPPVAIFKMATTIPHTNSTLFNFNVLNWFPTLKNFYLSPFSKWPPQYRTNSTLFDFNVLNWFPTLKNFYLSLFSKWPTQYRKNSTLFNFKGSF
jgi:hypothetical protein